MTNKNELNANERTENMKEKETKNKTCHEEKSSLPSIRGGVGRGDNSFETLKIDGFQKKISQHLIPRQTMLLSQHPLQHHCLVFADKRVSQSAKPIDLYPLAKIRSPQRGEGRKRAAFTLAETLIALVILGIVAAITVPQLVRKHVERANRTKFKKVMTVYDFVMNKIVTENDLKSNNAIQEWASNNGANDCGKAYNYFKAVKDLNNDNKCKFKTADGVFWDITDLQKPIVALKEEDLTDLVAQSDTNRAFYLYAQYDGQGILRVTEPNFNYTLTSDKTEVDASVDRLWAYLKGETNTSRAEVAQAPKTNADKLADCATGSEATCTIITSYDCEKTSENPEGACELEMTKQTFDTTNCNSASSLNGPSNSCPTKPINYFVIPEDQNGKSWNDASCPDGTHMAKAGELAQMTSVLTANCSNCWFWAQEEAPSIFIIGAYGFDAGNGGFYGTSKDRTYNGRVVCIGN